MDQSGMLLTPREAAEKLKVSIATLQVMRAEGSGPPFCKIGRRRVAYLLADISRWVPDRTASSTSDARERGLSSSINRRASA
jgi:predicted DNA-binding transcriptional regulator AlpA